MAEIIIMPKLGFNMREGKLVEWHKGEGDHIAKGEPLFSVETDKTNMEIEATVDGVVKARLVEAGETIPVTLPIAVIGTEEEEVSDIIAEAKVQLSDGGVVLGEIQVDEEVAPKTAAEVEASGQRTKPEDGAGRQKITPRARKVAAENGLLLEKLDIDGTGWGGGVCEQDILDYLESNKMKVTPVAKVMAETEGVSLFDISGTGINGKIRKCDVERALADASGKQAVMQTEGTSKEILEEVPYAGVRRVIGERLTESKFTAPHLYFTQKINMEKLLEMRNQVNSVQEKKTSMTDYIARAVVIALQKYPDMNASLVDETIIKYKSINLGIAVAAPTGLIVPNVKEAQNMSVVELSKASTLLFDKARTGKLTISEYTGGTFTISNLGMFGIENFTAIINPPEAGILSVSSINDEPVVVVNEVGNKEVDIKPMMNIQLTVDHRIIDGLLAAQFVAEVKAMLENPIRLLV